MIHIFANSPIDSLYQSNLILLLQNFNNAANGDQHSEVIKPLLKFKSKETICENFEFLILWDQM